MVSHVSSLVKGVVSRAVLLCCSKAVKQWQLCDASWWWWCCVVVTGALCVCVWSLYTSTDVLTDSNNDVTYSSTGQGCICQIFTGGQSFDWRLATIAGMEVAKLVLWNSLLN